MVKRFRNGTGGRQERPPADASDIDDGPPALRLSISGLNRFINLNAGRLPGQAVVQARWITDILLEIIDVPEGRSLDIEALVLVRSTAEDYLPTTLRTYLAIAEDQRDRTYFDGPTPTGTLLEQLDYLQSAASSALLDSRQENAHALINQSNFLRTKFTGSDLDLS